MTICTKCKIEKPDAVMRVFNGNSITQCDECFKKTQSNYGLAVIIMFIIIFYLMYNVFIR